MVKILGEFGWYYFDVKKIDQYNYFLDKFQDIFLWKYLSDTYR